MIGDKPGAYGKIEVGGGDGKELETLLATRRSVNGWLNGAEEVTRVEYLAKKMVEAMVEATRPKRRLRRDIM